MSKNIYFSFIHDYVSYCNMVWANAIRTKVNIILKKQKHVTLIIYNKYNLYIRNRWDEMRDMNALNVYQKNIFQVLKFMFEANHSWNPRVFDNTFKEIHRRYPQILLFLLVSQRVKDKTILSFLLFLNRIWGRISFFLTKQIAIDNKYKYRLVALSYVLL